MSIFDKILEIYQDYYICHSCLGRMFALLGTYTTNIERGYSLLLSLTLENHKKYLSSDNSSQIEGLKNLKILSEKIRFIPARKVLENEGISYINEFDELNCYLCNDIFDNIDKYVDKGLKILSRVEFDNFLIGTSPDPNIINKEDKFKSEFTLLESESFKSHFNRVIGKDLSIKLSKKPEFNNPEATLIYSIGYEKCEIELKLKPLFIYGRYNKLIRGIPQTHWDCRICKGLGCDQCNQTGKQYLTSVEELISPLFVIQAKATISKFHGAGREDIDVKMLGNGRPFILEIKDPQFRALDLIHLEKKINKKVKNKIKISNLRYTDKNEVIRIKENAENTRKLYRAICKINQKISKDVFQKKINKLYDKIENKTIKQKTPLRVSHRRADKEREKKVYNIKSKFIKPNLFEFQIDVQGGTYVKELIHGDEGRTTPSFAEIFEMPMICKELDVMEILQ
ncbi:MAG: tRNA pseudouridine(54/55) synthase Pus10 [Promethearchaeota archaeon]